MLNLKTILKPAVAVSTACSFLAPLSSAFADGFYLGAALEAQRNSYKFSQSKDTAIQAKHLEDKIANKNKEIAELDKKINTGDEPNPPQTGEEENKAGSILFDFEGDGTIIETLDVNSKGEVTTKQNKVKNLADIKGLLNKITDESKKKELKEKLASLLDEARNDANTKDAEFLKAIKELRTATLDVNKIVSGEKLNFEALKNLPEYTKLDQAKKGEVNKKIEDAKKVYGELEKKRKEFSNNLMEKVITPFNNAMVEQTKESIKVLNERGVQLSEAGNKLVDGYKRKLSEFRLLEKVVKPGFTAEEIINGTPDKSKTAAYNKYFGKAKAQLEDQKRQLEDSTEHKWADLASYKALEKALEGVDDDDAKASAIKGLKDNDAFLAKVDVSSITTGYTAPSLTSVTDPAAIEKAKADALKEIVDNKVFVNAVAEYVKKVEANEYADYTRANSEIQRLETEIGDLTAVNAINEIRTRVRIPAGGCAVGFSTTDALRNMVFSGLIDQDKDVESMTAFDVDNLIREKYNRDKQANNPEALLNALRVKNTSGVTVTGKFVKADGTLASGISIAEADIKQSVAHFNIDDIQVTYHNKPDTTPSINNNFNGTVEAAISKNYMSKRLDDGKLSETPLGAGSGSMIGAFASQALSAGAAENKNPEEKDKKTPKQEDRADLIKKKDDLKKQVADLEQKKAALGANVTPSNAPALDEGTFSKISPAVSLLGGYKFQVDKFSISTEIGGSFTFAGTMGDNSKNQLEVKRSGSIYFAPKFGYEFLENNTTYVTAGVGMAFINMKFDQTGVDDGVSKSAKPMFFMLGAGNEYAISKDLGIFIELNVELGIKKTDVVSQKSNTTIGDVKLSSYQLKFGFRYYPQI